MPIFVYPFVPLPKRTSDIGVEAPRVATLYAVALQLCGTDTSSLKSSQMIPVLTPGRFDVPPYTPAYTVSPPTVTIGSPFTFVRVTVTGVPCPNAGNPAPYRIKPAIATNPAVPIFIWPSSLQLSFGTVPLAQPHLIPVTFNRSSTTISIKTDNLC